MCENVYDKAWEQYEAGEYEEAYLLFLDLANEGEVAAQTMVANMLLQGMGVEKNSDLAYNYYFKAAVQNDAEALYMYGWYALKKIDEKEGLEYIIKSADASYLEALYSLGGMYYFGMHGCQKDMTKAFEYYEKAFFLGKKEAINDMLKVKAQEIGKVRAIVYFIKRYKEFSGILLAK